MVEVGQVIRGKYRLLRLLGDGGMGSVYEAEHVDLGTHVAIKVLHADLARKAGLIDRFLQEARVSAQIRSPHVASVTDVERTPDGVAYLVMELLQGEPLSNLVRRERKLEVSLACEYTLQILRGLEAAHSLGVVHRDLKPDNDFVTFEGGRPVLKLIDFGIAKLKRTGSDPQTKSLTVAGMLMGTPEYMAPEQAYSADKVDVRADLYSVGVMLYEMLSGAVPVSGDDPRVLVLKVERGEVQPLVHVAPGVKPELAGFVHRAMAPRPEVRFANATEMRLALESIVSGKKSSTAPLPASPAAPVVAPASALAGTGMMPDGAFADTANPRAEHATGTVMGAPAYSVAPGGAATGTAIGAPAAAALASERPPGFGAMGYAPPPAPAAGREPKRRGSGLVIALALVATLLGAGAVVTYVMSTQEATPPPPAFPLATETPTTPGTAPTTPGTVTTTSPTSVAPLKPGPAPAPGPAPQTAPKPTPAKPDAGTTQAHADAGSSVPHVGVDAAPPAADRDTRRSRRASRRWSRAPTSSSRAAASPLSGWPGSAARRCVRVRPTTSTRRSGRSLLTTTSRSRAERCSPCAARRCTPAGGSC